MAIPTSFRNGVEVNGAVFAADDAFFIGDRDTNGSWKMYSNSGVYTIARRESGSWVDKFTLSSAAGNETGIIFGDGTTDGSWKVEQSDDGLVFSILHTSVWVPTFTMTEETGDETLTFGEDLGLDTLRIRTDGSEGKFYFDHVIQVDPSIQIASGVTIAPETGDISAVEVTQNRVALDQSAAPDDPDSGYSTMWMDSTTGDIMIKINFGGTTKTATLADYSAL